MGRGSIDRECKQKDGNFWGASNILFLVWVQFTCMCPDNYNTATWTFITCDFFLYVCCTSIFLNFYCNFLKLLKCCHTCTHRKKASFWQVLKQGDPIECLGEMWFLDLWRMIPTPCQMEYGILPVLTQHLIKLPEAKEECF